MLTNENREIYNAEKKFFEDAMRDEVEIPLTIALINPNIIKLDPEEELKKYVIEKFDSIFSSGLSKEAREAVFANKYYDIIMENEESTLYIPRFYRGDTEGLSKKQLFEKREYLKGYVGAKVNVIIKEIMYNEDGSIKEIKVSMKALKEKMLASLEELAAKTPFEVNVNVLAARRDYLVVEWKGLVQTISRAKLSYAEIPSVKDFYISNQPNISRMQIKSIDVEKGVIDIDRRPVTENKFGERVVNQKFYNVGDACLGKIIGVTPKGQLLIEVEPELVAVGYRPEGVKLKLNQRVKCTVSGIRVDKEISKKLGFISGKLILTRITV